MELNLNPKIKQFISALILFLIPLLFIIISMAINFAEMIKDSDIPPAIIYILFITWFSIGLIFYGAIYQKTKTI